MKKVLSLMLAAVMAVSVFALSVVPAMAEDVYSPTATTAKDEAPTLQVNGKTTTTDITYSVEGTAPVTATFEYVGDGEITGWETNLDKLGFVEGEDYVLTENEDGTLTIEFLTEEAVKAWKTGELVVNAVVDFEGETTVADTTKKNDSSKSPSTGIAAVAMSAAAAAGAGFAVLSALKKRDSE